jgi:hypothetical protein
LYGAKNMNMISTGAFQTEMDASNKQPSIAEKFAAVWEKKNAKAARAGGVSLMALSLAACGSDDSTTTTTTTTDTTTTDTTTTTTTTPASQSFNLTASATGDDFLGGDGDDTFTALTTARLQDADSLSGGAGNDTLTAALNSATAHDGASIVGIETLNFTLYGAATMAGATISGATTVNVDGGYVLTYSGHSAEVFNVSGAASGLTTQKAADGTADTITVSLDSGIMGSISIGQEGTMEYETVNLIANGATSATLADAGTDDWTDADEKIVITGDSDLTLAVAHGGFGSNATSASAAKATIDATAATGNITLDLGVADNEFIDVSKMTGVDGFRLGSDNGNANATVTIKSGFTGQTIHIDAAADATDDFTATLGTDGSDDSVTLKVDSGTAGTSVTFDVFTANAYETVNVTGSGTNTATATVAHTIGAVDTTGAGSKLTVGGDKKVTISGVDADFSNITVSNTVATDLTIDSGKNVTFTGGTGKDRIEFDTIGDLTTLDSLTGGDGVDTLAFSDEAQALNAGMKAVTGFEVLEFEGATDLTGTAPATTAQAINLTLATASSLNTLYLNGSLTVDGTDTLTVTGTDGFTLQLGVDDTITSAATPNFDIVVKDAATAGTDNTVNVKHGNVTTGVSIDGFQIDDVENLTIDLAGDFTSADVITYDDIDGAQLQNITITSSNTTANTASDSLTMTEIESTLLKSIDASAFTGVLDIAGVSDNFAATGGTFTGGSGATTVTGGAGADNMTTGKGADTVSGGDGADTITSGAGADHVYADSGNAESGVATYTEAAVANNDTVIMTLFGQALTVTLKTGTAAINTLDEVVEDLADLINADADLSNLVTATYSAGAANTAKITVTAKGGGNLTDFTVGGLTTTETITVTDGTDQNDIDTVNAGDGADAVVAGSGKDVIDLGASDEDADTVYFLSTTEFGDTITNFEGGVNGTDRILFEKALVNNNSETNTLVSIANASSATVDSRVFFEITTATAAGAADTAAEIVTHLANVTLTSIASGDDIIFAVNDGSDMYLWNFIEDGTAGIQADDLTLVATLKGVTDIADGDLAYIA